MSPSEMPSKYADIEPLTAMSLRSNSPTRVSSSTSVAPAMRKRVAGKIGSDIDTLPG